MRGAKFHQPPQQGGGEEEAKEAVPLVLTAESVAGDRLKRDWTDSSCPSKDGRIDGATVVDRLFSGRAV